MRELQRINGIRGHLIYPGDQIVLYEKEAVGAKSELARSRSERGNSMRRSYRPLFRRTEAVGGPDISSAAVNSHAQALPATYHERAAARMHAGTGM